MSGKKWGEFEYWQTLYQDKLRSLEGLFSSELLSADSIFIWYEIAPPKRSTMINGKWDVYPEPKALAGFLRYIGFPVYFDIWLQREEWDRNSAAFTHPDEVLDLAASPFGSRFKDAIPVMQEIYSKLDELFGLPDAAVRKGLREVADLFNQNWSDTDSWHFKIKIFDTAPEVGEEVFSTQKDSNSPFEMSKRDWLELCAAATKDPQAQTRFLKILSENALF